jgi:predicted transcriptional regulator
MIDKGLVARDDSHRSHVYRPLIAERQVERSVIREILADLFGGSPTRLAMCALSEEITDPDDLDLIRKRLEELKRKAK